MRYRHIIKDAIDQRKVIELRYKDVTRRVRPHILGYVGHDELALSGWQISGTGAGWRLFHVNDISELAATEQGFRGTARGYNPNDPAFSRILDRI
jgi:predicted DNA-binding transcriptional regulator YafY